MTHLIGGLVAAALLGGIAIHEPGDDALASWRERCVSAEDVLRHAERSRNGVSITCNEVVLERSAAR